MVRCRVSQCKGIENWNHMVRKENKVELKKWKGLTVTKNQNIKNKPRNLVFTTPVNCNKVQPNKNGLHPKKIKAKCAPKNYLQNQPLCGSNSGLCKTLRERSYYKHEITDQFPSDE